MQHSINMKTYQEVLMAEKIAVIVWDIKADALRCDAFTRRIFPAAAFEKPFSHFIMHWRAIHLEDRKLFRPVIDFAREPHPEYQDSTYKLSLDYRVRSKCREPWQWHRVSLFFSFQGEEAQEAVILFRNIDEERRREENLSFKATRDPMTGVYNKQSLRELVTRLLEEKPDRHAMLVLDMDGFKQVNDNMGHMAGDLVIQDMALSLKSIFRASDIIGRLGGDEFVVFLPGVRNLTVIEERCNQLRQQLRRKFLVDDKTVVRVGGMMGRKKEIRVSASIGIALAPDHGTTYEELLANADAALYEAKNQGRDMQVMYQPEYKKAHRKEELEGQDMDRQKNFFDQPMEFIFRTLYETGDARATVELLMEMFAKFFKVQRVFIYQKVSRTKWGCWFEWYMPDVLPTAEAHAGAVQEYVNSNYKNDIYGVFSECNDTRGIGGDIGQMFIARNIYAFIHAGILSGGDRIGCVGFDDCKGPRVWSKQEHEILQIFANILGNVLMTQMRFDMIAKQREHLRLVLDAHPGKFWVLAGNQTRLYYLSQATRRYLQQVIPPTECENCFCLITHSNRACLHCALYKPQEAVCPVLVRLHGIVGAEGLQAKTMEWNRGESAVFYSGSGEDICFCR